MAVVVIRERHAALFDLLLAECVENTLRYDGRTVIHTHYLTLDDGRNDQVDDLLNGDLGFVEHLGNDDHRIVARRTYTEGQVTRTAPHSGQNEPIAARARVVVDRARQHRTLVLGRLITESRHPVRKRKVVIDGFGNVDVGNGILLGFEERGDTVGRRGGVVATHGDQKLHVIVLKEFEIEILVEILLRRFEAAHLKERSPEVENIVGKRKIDVDGTELGAEKPAVTAVKTDHAITFLDKRFGDAAHDSVHPGSRTTARQDCNSFFHNDVCVFVLKRFMTGFPISPAKIINF